MRLRLPSFRVKLPGLEIDLRSGPEVRVLLNGGVKMSRGKAAAQAVHAALQAFDVVHGRVVVLHGTPAELAQMQVQIRDAGVTEVAPGTLTAGASLQPAEVPPRLDEAGALAEVRVSPSWLAVAMRWSGSETWLAVHFWSDVVVPMTGDAVESWTPLEVPR